MKLATISTVQMTLENKPYYPNKCKYCGKHFIKKHNREVYCSDECRTKAHQDQDAMYRRRRRQLINKGVIISNENNYTGTGFLSCHRRDNDKDEHAAIKKEMRRFKLK